MDELREVAPIQLIIGQYVGLRGIRKGKDGIPKEYVGLCPFHPEKHPSFTVCADREFWCCHCCNNSGEGLFAFIMQFEQVSYPRAIEIVAVMVGFDLNSKTKKERVKKVRKNKKNKAVEKR